MTPTIKGFYNECQSCRFKISYSRYPCSHSHKVIRKASGVKLERDFKKCGKFEEKLK